MTLLITAFGHFDGGWNASERLLDTLETATDGIEHDWGGDVAFARFAVDTATIADHLRRTIDLCRPTHLLLMGQATARDAVALERTARNTRNLGAPDVAGRTGAHGPVVEGGPDTRVASWPDLEGAAAALTGAGVPATVSDDAGTHLCNQTLYLALEAAGPLATFLHVPLSAEQVTDGLPAAKRRPGCCGMPLSEMVRAVRLILRHTAAVERLPTARTCA